MKKLTTVSIGIPAYNEEKNIVKILNDLLNQKTSNYNLEKIIVANDGSTDQTLEIINQYFMKNKIIEVIGDNKRIGKSSRLNEIYGKINSDIYVNFDADIRIFDKNALSELVKQFNNPKIGLVGGQSLPHRPETFFEKIVIAWIDVWNDVRLNVNNGNNIHNHLGCISAMRKEIYENIKLPDSFIADEDFIFFKTLELGYKFKFARNAKAYYKPVSNLEEFFHQHSRFLSIKWHISDLFGEYVNEYYSIPNKVKFKSLFKELINNTFYLSLSILLQITLIIYLKFNQKKYAKGVWRIAISTK